MGSSSYKSRRSDKHIEAQKTVYHVMWYGSPIFPNPDEQSRQPISETHIKYIHKIARNNSKSDIRFCFDSKRYTKAQLEWLENEMSDLPNIILFDLRDIPEYENEPLYDQPDKSSDLRSNKNSMLWRQVDTARFLASLHSFKEYYSSNSEVQIFYADLDVSNLLLDSEEVQKIIGEYGILLGAVLDTKTGRAWYANGAFGFDKRMFPFFELLYKKTLEHTKTKGKNGYIPYIEAIKKLQRDGLDPKNIVYPLKFFGPGKDVMFIDEIMKDMEKSNYPVSDCYVEYCCIA